MFQAIKFLSETPYALSGVGVMYAPFLFGNQMQNFLRTIYIMMTIKQKGEKQWQ